MKRIRRYRCEECGAHGWRAWLAHTRWEYGGGWEGQVF